MPCSPSNRPRPDNSALPVEPEEVAAAPDRPLPAAALEMIDAHIARQKADDFGERGRGARPPRPHFDLKILRAAIKHPTYGDRLRNAAWRVARERPHGALGDNFARAATLAGPVPRVRGRKLSRAETRARRLRYAGVLGRAVARAHRAHERPSRLSCGTRHRRAPSARGARRRGSRRSTRAGPGGGEPPDAEADPDPHPRLVRPPRAFRHARIRRGGEAP